MSDEIDELREVVMEKTDDPLALVDSQSEEIITTATTTHELTMQTKTIDYDPESTILFTPWDRKDVINIRLPTDETEIVE
jgi:hypothetical protein